MTFSPDGSAYFDREGITAFLKSENFICKNLSVKDVRMICLTTAVVSVFYTGPTVAPFALQWRAVFKQP